MARIKWVVAAKSAMVKTSVGNDKDSVLSSRLISFKALTILHLSGLTKVYKRHITMNSFRSATITGNRLPSFNNVYTMNRELSGALLLGICM